MLVVLVLVPLSSLVYDGNFDHGGGGGGCGSPAAVGVAAVAAGEAAAPLRNVGGSLAAARWRWQCQWRQCNSAMAVAALRRRGGGVGGRRWTG